MIPFVPTSPRPVADIPPTPPPAPARVLVVDPDTRVQRWLAQCLQPHGHRVHAAADAEAIAQAPACGFDLVLMSPRASDATPGTGRRGATGDAWLGLRGLRDAAPRLPVIVLQPHADATDRAVALELGADAVVDDRCEPRELRARVTSLLRRHREDPRGLPGAGPAAAGGWRLDPARRGVHAPPAAERPADTPGFIPLSPSEFRLLRALMQRIGQPMSRARLLDEALGASALQRDRSVDLLVSRLRRTLGDDPVAPRLIRTVRGAGYCFMPRSMPVGSCANPVSNPSHDGDTGLTRGADDHITGTP